MSFVNKETVRIQIEAFRGAQGPVGPAGPQGVQGPAGADGRDYILTEADKQEIAGMVGGSGGGSSVELDDTLTQSGKAADAKATGDAIDALKKANAAQDTVITKKANDDDLAAVAKSGSYEDLKNKPTIPTVPSTLPNPNKLKITGAVTAEYDGSAEVSVEIPEGGGNEYTLPVATSTTLGGVMPVVKTDAMTQAVGVDANGGLWALPGGGGSDTPTIEVITEATIEEEVTYIYFDIDFSKYEAVILNAVQTENNSESYLNLADNMSTYIGSYITIYNHAQVVVRPLGEAWYDVSYRSGYTGEGYMISTYEKNGVIYFPNATGIKLLKGSNWKVGDSYRCIGIRR